MELTAAHAAPPSTSAEYLLAADAPLASAVETALGSATHPKPDLLLGTFCSQGVSWASPAGTLHLCVVQACPSMGQSAFGMLHVNRPFRSTSAGPALPQAADGGTSTAVPTSPAGAEPRTSSPAESSPASLHGSQPASAGAALNGIAESPASSSDVDEDYAPAVPSLKPFDMWQRQEVSAACIPCKIMYATAQTTSCSAIDMPRAVLALSVPTSAVPGFTVSMLTWVLCWG